MSFENRASTALRYREELTFDESIHHGISPGKRILTMSLPPRSTSAAAPAQAKREPAADAAREEQAALTARWMDTAMRPDLHAAPVQCKLASTDGNELAPVRSDGSGQRLPGPVQAKMEHALGSDFSAVRIHEGAQAASIGALAYTRGTDIHFAPGQYDPESRRGQELLGHELTHVVQQARGRVGTTTQAKGLPVNDDPGLEREADELGARAARGEAVHDSPAPQSLPTAAWSGALQRMLATTGLPEGADTSTPEKHADAIIAKIGQARAYQDLVSQQGADAVRTKLIDMIRSATDHGSFNLASLAGPRQLVRKIEAEFPVPVFEVGQTVQEGTFVGFVKDVTDRGVLVQFVRKLSDPDDAQTYLDDPPEPKNPRDLRPSAAVIRRERERPRSPELRMASARDVSPHGKPVREPARNSAPSRVVSAQDVSARLPGSPERGARVAPKDFSFVPEAMHLQFMKGDKAGAAHIEQMALIGLDEGFRVTVLVAEEDERALLELLSPVAQRNITLNRSERQPSQWAEDSGEFHVDGSVHVPNRAPNMGSRSPEDAMREGREARGFYLAEKDRQDSDISRLGAMVSDRSSQKDKVATGIAERARGVYENTSYIEGGNMLTGTHANGRPFALIGMDALYATRKQILPARDGAATPDDEARVKNVISRDIGIDPVDIHFVEQPGEFHLDMKMAVMGPGQVLVNDAFDVFDLQQEWILEDYESKRGSMPQGEWEALYPEIDRELAELSRKAQRAWAYETRTIEHLSQVPGLRIVRVAANFPGTRTLPTMNFLNGEGGRGLDDSPFFVTNGGDPRAEAYIARMYLEELHTGLRRLYFLDREYSELSLRDSGGVGCRTKGQGSVRE